MTDTESACVPADSGCSILFMMNRFCMCFGIFLLFSCIVQKTVISDIDKLEIRNTEREQINQIDKVINSIKFDPDCGDTYNFYGTDLRLSGKNPWRLFVTRRLPAKDGSYYLGETYTYSNEDVTLNVLERKDGTKRLAGLILQSNRYLLCENLYIGQDVNEAISLLGDPVVENEVSGRRRITVRNHSRDEIIIWSAGGVIQSIQITYDVWF